MLQAWKSYRRQQGGTQVRCDETVHFDWQPHQNLRPQVIEWQINTSTDLSSTPTVPAMGDIAAVDGNPSLPGVHWRFDLQQQLKIQLSESTPDPSGGSGAALSPT